jgi:benzoyl-CoA 2,3-dioxygenase component B
VGAWAGTRTDPQGNPVTAEVWHARERDWLPSAEDRAFVGSLMQRMTEPGKFAGWIAPPDGGINNRGLAYEYVRLN